MEQRPRGKNCRLAGCTLARFLSIVLNLHTATLLLVFCSQAWPLLSFSAIDWVIFQQSFCLCHWASLVLPPGLLPSTFQWQNPGVNSHQSTYGHQAFIFLFIENDTAVFCKAHSKLIFLESSSECSFFTYKKKDVGFFFPFVSKAPLRGPGSIDSYLI